MGLHPRASGTFWILWSPGTSTRSSNMYSNTPATGQFLDKHKAFPTLAECSGMVTPPTL